MVLPRLSKKFGVSSRSISCSLLYYCNSFLELWSSWGPTFSSRFILEIFFPSGQDSSSVLLRKVATPPRMKSTTGHPPVFVKGTLGSSCFFPSSSLFEKGEGKQKKMIYRTSAPNPRLGICLPSRGKTTAQKPRAWRS